MPLQSIKTVLTDLNIQKQDLNWTLPNGSTKFLGFVHKGFYEAVAAFINPLLGNASQYIKMSKQSNPSGKPIINVVGHSLGGALANIFASVLSVVAPEAQIYLTTFGSPRVGSPTWVKNLETNDQMHILRVVNAEDVITMVPSSVGLGDSVMHAGLQLTVGWNTVSKECADSKLVEMTSMYSLLDPDWELERKCAIASISDYHMKYGPNLKGYFDRIGFDYQQKRWCNLTGESSSF